MARSGDRPQRGAKRGTAERDGGREGTRGYVRQNVVYDARYQGTVKIEYSLNPLFGLDGVVARQVKYGGATFVEVRIEGKLVTVPQWMTRPELCQFLTCGFDPMCDWESLRQLLKVLDQEV